MNEIREALNIIISQVEELEQLRERNVILAEKNRALEATILSQEKLIKALRFNGPPPLSQTIIKQLNGNSNQSNSKHQGRMDTSNNKTTKLTRK